MEPHPIPRQITSFEFKLVGFLTLRQFIYIAIFSGLGVVFFYGIPIPLINVAATVGSALFGLALAFIPVNERPLDVFIKNGIRKIFSPTQYYYQKKNAPPAFVINAQKTSHDRAQDHAVAAQKLNDYLNQQKEVKTDDRRKETLSKLFSSPSVSDVKNTQKKPMEKIVHNPDVPFLSGIVKNSKNTPLPGILIYIKNKDGQPLRILKTNTHGLFATFHSLPPGEYSAQIKDPQNSYFFDDLTISITDKQPKPIDIVSREIL